jgi:hypothetical protein
MTLNDESRRPVLDAALRSVREDERGWGAAPVVEARLLAAVRQRAAVRRQASMTMLAAAAVLILAIAIPLWRLAVTNSGVRTARSAEPVEVTTAFFPLAGASLQEPGGQIVRLELPRSALARFGLDTAGRDGASTVLADVIVSEEGLARAVRFVTGVARQEKESVR